MKVLPGCKTIDQFVTRLSDGLGKRPAKFVQDMIIGIYRARSVNLTEITAVLGEDISQHATHKRLSRNLTREDLVFTLSDRLLKYSAGAVTPDTRLIVVSYGIHKPHARKMQYLHDATDETMEDDGYRVCEIVANDAGSGTYIPLLTTLWSRHAPGFASDTAEIRQAIDRVLAATKGRGVVTMDYGFIPRPAIVDLIRDADFRFVVTGLGDVIHRKQTISVDELIEQCETPYGGTMFKLFADQEDDPDAELTTESSLFMHFGSVAIQLPDSDRPRSMVVLKTTRMSGDSGRYAALFTSESKPRSRQAHMDILSTFFSVRDVADTLSAQKSNYKPADFRVLTYERLKLLMTLLQAVVFFESRNFKVQNQVVSLQPILGDYRRDFLLPGEVEELRNKRAEG
jgi:hypothetical protein